MRSLVLIIIIALISTSSIHAGGIAFQFNQSQGQQISTMKISKNPGVNFLVTSFVIGNIISWMMGAWPKDFPVKSYTAEEQSILLELQEELQEVPDDDSLRVELGSIYFQHNELDKAESELEKAIALNPHNSEGKSWYYANQVKQSGAMFDLSMGLLKLYKLNTGIEGLNQTVQEAPEDAVIRITRLATLASVGTRVSSFSLFQEDERWFLDKQVQDQDYFSPGIERGFYLNFARAYFTQSLADTEESNVSASQKKSRQ